MKLKNISLQKSYPYILVVGGLIGMLCSFVLTMDKFKMLENPAYQPNCNLNPILACGDVLKTAQGSAFGFPNPFLGLAAFAVLVTIGMGIIAGAKYKKWFMIGLQIGTVFGMAFIGWLFFQSLYRIHALCPYCMGVWVVVITTFFYTTLYNIDNKVFRINKKYKPIYEKVRKYHLDILIIFFVLIALYILKHFWYYFGKHL